MPTSALLSSDTTVQNRFEGQPSVDPDQLLCCPGGSLRLTKKQLTDIIQHVKDQVIHLQAANEMWFKERDEFIAEHESEFGHRKRPGEIFSESNVSFNQSRRNTMPVVARLTRDYLGTEPFFAVTPIRLKGNSDLADRIQDYERYKMKQAGLKPDLAEAIETAAVVGERVMKITHIRDVSFYKRTANVLMGANGKEVRTSKDDVIYDYDEWVDAAIFADDAPPVAPGQPGVVPVAPPAPVGVLPPPMPFPADAPAVPIQTPAPGTLVLKKDPSMVRPADPLNFQRRSVDLQDVRYSGAKAKGLHHRDFLCDLSEDDIQTSPFIAQIVDITVPALAQRYIAPVETDLLDAEEKAFFGDLETNFLSLQGSTPEPKSAEKKAEHALGEVSGGHQDTLNGRVKVVEAYLTCDVDGDLRQEDIMISIAFDESFAFFFDYTANIVPPVIGRPFRPVLYRGVRNRWYGMGEYQWNRHDQNFIDWCVNRILFENSISGMIRWFNPDFADGWDMEPPRAGETLYRIKSPGPNFNPANGAGYITMPPLSDTSLELMKMKMQANQAESGNQSPGGDTLNQLPSSKLKYGIQALERAGDEGYSLKAIGLENPVESVVFAMIATDLANMDDVEEYEYTQGDQTLTATMNRSEVDNLKFNVSLEMTLARGDQLYDQNTQATELVKEYMGFPAFQRTQVRPFYVKRLRAIDIQDADEAVPVPSDQEVQLSYQAYMQSMMPPPAPPVKPAPGGGVPGGDAHGGGQPGPTPKPI
jgi:hypothetical protein